MQMLRRARSSWFLTALLVLGLVVPAGALVAGPCCCLDMADAQQVGAPQGAHSCCSAQCQSPEPDEDDTQDDDGTTCDDCDCLGACCTFGKAPVGVSSFARTLAVCDRDELARPVGDRWSDPGEIFELVHPPRA